MKIQQKRQKKQKKNNKSNLYNIYVRGAYIKMTFKAYEKKNPQNLKQNHTIHLFITCSY